MHSNTSILLGILAFLGGPIQTITAFPTRNSTAIYTTDSSSHFLPGLIPDAEQPTTFNINKWGDFRNATSLPVFFSTGSKSPTSAGNSSNAVTKVETEHTIQKRATCYNPPHDGVEPSETHRVEMRREILNGRWGKSFYVHKDKSFGVEWYGTWVIVEYRRIVGSRMPDGVSFNLGELAWALDLIGGACCRNDWVDSCRWGEQWATSNIGLSIKVLLRRWR